MLGTTCTNYAYRLVAGLWGCLVSAQCAQILTLFLAGLRFISDWTIYILCSIYVYVPKMHICDHYLFVIYGGGEFPFDITFGTSNITFDGQSPSANMTFSWS